ncbi:MAG: MotA/TolQ/ExbB proton channel family protein [Candidatus Lambdaproteobacteria bacterium]|nr:MotA/TolQ/ExbB proton channel family protein [Candidatus Lambdaproteobacteria bacterium]
MVGSGSADESAWSLIFTGNWVALAILLILVLMSAASWAIIVLKWMQFRRVRAENAHFFHGFQRDPQLAKVFALAQKLPLSPLARMFEVSYREIQSFRGALEQDDALEGARERLMQNLSRTLERMYNQQSMQLERLLPFLATVSGSAPFIGLFGTVLGIIDAFRGIGVAGVTSLAVVAPGISEALVATAAGLMAAIPALIAYNVFRNRIRDYTTGMKNFALDLTNRLERVL